MLRDYSIDKARFFLLITILSLLAFLAAFLARAQVGEGFSNEIGAGAFEIQSVQENQEDIAEEVSLEEETYENGRLINGDIDSASEEILGDVISEIETSQDEDNYELNTEDSSEFVEDAVNFSSEQDIFVPIENISLSFEKDIVYDEKSEGQGELPLVLFEDGAKAVETIIEEDDIVEIHKDEYLLGQLDDEWKKRVKIYSLEHFERPLTVFTDIVEISNIDLVKIYWLKDGERVDITDDSSFDLEFYDEDGDGLFDRISFIVPHLSEQNFEIVINMIGSISNSTNLQINVLNVPSGSLNRSSLLGFNFSISYYNPLLVRCNLDILNSGTVLFNQNNFTGNVTGIFANLSNGNYTWNVFCFDT